MPNNPFANLFGTQGPSIDPEAAQIMNLRKEANAASNNATDQKYTSS